MTANIVYFCPLHLNRKVSDNYEYYLDVARGGTHQSRGGTQQYMNITRVFNTSVQNTSQAVNRRNASSKISSSKRVETRSMRDTTKNNPRSRSRNR